MPETTGPMAPADPAKAEAEVERLDDRLADLHEQRNLLLDRSVEIAKEVKAKKAALAAAVTSGDLEALADDSAEAEVRRLEKEGRRVSQSLERLKKQITTSQKKREKVIGSAVDHFDGKLAELEAEIREDLEAIAAPYLELHRNWTRLASERRKLVAAHNAWRAPGSNRRHVGIHPRDLPERREVAGDDLPPVSWLDSELPHLAPWREKNEVYRQSVAVRSKA